MLITKVFLNLNLNVILLSLPFLAILFCWIYLIAISVRSYRNLKEPLDKKVLVNNNNSNSKDNFPYVSIIVPARNEQDNIERSLVSLIEQNYPNLNNCCR